MPMHQVYLSLGSNMGDRLGHLMEGIKYLLRHKMRMRDCSGIYETEPVGYTAQQAFLNIVLYMETTLQPLEVLQICQEAEQERLRERTIRWGPRTLDVDILLFDDLTLDLPALTIPHPRMGERAFVLGPLAEIDPLVLVKWGFSRATEGIVMKILAEDVKQSLFGEL